MNIDFTQFVGLTGVPLLEQAVQYLKNEWGMPAYLAPLAALLGGVILNDGLAFYLHFSLLMGLYVGLFTGFSTSFWHEMAKANNNTVVNNSTTK